MEHESLTAIAEWVFPTHAACWNQRADIIALHVLGDGITAVAYYTIPLMLFIIMRRYHFHSRLKFVFGIYAAFVLLCGTTHVVDVVLVWYAAEWLLLVDGFVRIFTGVLSLFSALVTAIIALRFVDFATRYAAIAVQMSSEREQNDRVRSETYKAWQTLQSEITGLVHTADET